MLKEQIIAKGAAAFNKVRGRLNPAVRLFLLKVAGQTQKFEVIAEIPSGFWSRWSDYRDQTVFIVADADSSLKDKFAQTSYIAYGEGIAGEKLDVYAITQDARDRIPPSDASVFWKFYATRQKEKRFTIPLPEPEEEEEP